MITVVLADDHRVMRQGLKALLNDSGEFDVIGEADDGKGAIKLTESLKPDVLVLDMAMPDTNGATVTHEVMKRVPRTAVVILSMYNIDGYIRKAMQAGARAYVLKEETSEELLYAMREALAGRRYLSKAAAQRAFDFYVEGTSPITPDANLVLSKREREVLPFIAEGLTARQIAGKLQVSPRTAEFHRGNIMHKLGLKSEKELIRYCLRTGIIPGNK